VNQVINKKVKFLDLGLKITKETWDFQEELFARTVALENRKQEIKQMIHQLATDNYLIFVEHPHVYTLGKSGELSSLIIGRSMDLKEKRPLFTKSIVGGISLIMVQVSW
jgi:lipoyl(octanoyl) transferase